MTQLLWDQPGSRSYETGLSHGVLYLSDGTAVPWNGLKSVDDVFTEETSSSIFVDGLKYAEEQSYGDYAGTLSAFTFPDEFLEYDGVSSIGGGIFVDDQQPKRFGLSYRTEVSDDINGTGYQIHVLYNLIALSDTRAYKTIADTTTPNDFTWSLSAVPSSAAGFRPTAHIVIDSRYTKPYIQTLVENQLYGTTTTAPSLPTLQSLMDMITGYSMIYVVDNGDGTITISGDSSVIYATGDLRVWQVDQANVLSSDATSYTINDTKDY